MIKIENLVHKYTIWKDENTKSEKTVLDGISLDIPSGQFVAILGPNGSGKSTLAKHLNVLLLPNEGTVWIDGKDTHAKERLWEIRSQVGMVFQNPDNQIIGTSVEEDVAFGPENKNIEPEKIRKIVETVLRKVKLWDRRKASPSRLSGGQKQRLATADALAGLPACLVLDEPTSQLDPLAAGDFLATLRKINAELGTTILLIEHRLEEVLAYADRVLVMSNKKIAMYDTVEKVFARAPELLGLGLSVPQVTKIFLKLREMGVDVPADVYTIPYAVKMVLEAKRRRDAGETLVLPRADKQEGGADKC